MLKFSIDGDNIHRLQSLLSPCKTILPVTKSLFIAENDSLEVKIYSDTNVINYSINITNLTLDPINYFSTDINQFINIINNATTDSIDIIVDSASNKVTAENPKTKTKLSVFTEPIAQALVDEQKTIIDTFVQTEFANPVVANLDAEVINFYDVAQKFMNTSLASNAICVNQNRVKYADFLVILEKTLTKNVTSTATDIFLQKNIIEFVKPFLKTSQNIALSFNVTSNRVYIDAVNFGLKAVLTLLPVQYEYPTQAELDMFTPEDKRCTELTINKNDLESALRSFNGIFKAENWKFGHVTFAASKEQLSKENKVHIEHSDYTAECFVDCPITVVSDTEPEDTTFLASSTCLLDFLKIISEDELNIRFNNLDSATPHGPGFNLITPTVKAVCCKIAASN